MFAGHLEKAVREEIEPVLTGMGFTLVDLSVGRLKGSTRVAVVVFRREGVGIDECGEISRLIHPRLQMMEGLDDVSLEVSSPGIDRTLKRPEEYEIFLGRGVRVLPDGETEWVGGVIEKVQEGTISLRSGGRVTEYRISSIRKARLDHTVEPRAEAGDGGRRRGG
jgi:ribosome maturation factor RimP